MASFTRGLKDLRYKVFYGLLLRRGNLLELGNRATGCNWFFHPDGLDAGSIVYSGGIGRDVTFEHALVKRFGSQIVLFDPTPTGQKTINLPENKIPNFNYHPVALAGSCGELTLSQPQDENEGSWELKGGGGVTIKVPSVDLASLMQKNGHKHIDLLKIDIEGAEYGVIDHLLERRLAVKQILVEFHHQMQPDIPRSRTIRAILKLVSSGYRLLKQDGNNHTFIRQ